jgi:hypothetical protein
MRSISLRLATLACLVGVNAPVGAYATHATHEAATVSSPAAARWATDAPLREGMQGIRAAAEALEHYEHGHLRPDHAVLLAERIEGHVRDIVARCRLAPEADAALHAILASILRSTGALKSDPHAPGAIASLRRALVDYGRQFDDPGFAQK